MPAGGVMSALAIPIRARSSGCHNRVGVLISGHLHRAWPVSSVACRLPAASGPECNVTDPRCRRTDPLPLPVAHCPVSIEDPLQGFRLERVARDFLLVQLDAEARPLTGFDDPLLSVDLETFLHDVRPPRDIIVHGLADDVARLTESELERGSRTDRSLWIVGSERRSRGLAQCGDPPGHR